MTNVTSARGGGPRPGGPGHVTPVSDGRTRAPTRITCPRSPPHGLRSDETAGPSTRLRGGAPPHASGRTTPRIGIEPAPAIVTVRPGRGACTIAPSPTYIPTWVASSK